MTSSYFGNSESETESRVFGILDSASDLRRISQEELVGCVSHLITGDPIRPDGLIVFPNREEFRCLRGRRFALEIKPDSVIRDHLKVISELTEQARSYVDSKYYVKHRHFEVDGCIIYPGLETILKQMQEYQQTYIEQKTEPYKSGVLDMHRRVLARQRIYELVLMDHGFGVLCCDEWLCRYGGGHWRITGKNHQFQRKVGSKYR
ncbi:MAG TPA: hypothetical protein PKA83_19975 [Pirellulaceae bacterium]|mgnify:CR=1 FL=1|nr:hypothetical protein [Pirellulaceae bacterium]